MFFGILFIAIGLALLLNTLGLMSGSFWGFFWAIFFLAVGLRMMIRRGKCPMCGWGMCCGKMHDKIHQKMNGQCCGNNHNHGEEHDHE